MNEPIRDGHAALQCAAVELTKADRLLDVAMAAKRLNRCQETIRRYIRRGHLRAQRAPLIPGRTRAGNFLVSESAIVDFLRQHTTSHHT